MRASPTVSIKRKIFSFTKSCELLPEEDECQGQRMTQAVVQCGNQETHETRDSSADEARHGWDA